MVFYTIAGATFGYFGAVVLCEVLDMEFKLSDSNIPKVGDVCVIAGIFIGGLCGLSYDYTNIVFE